MFLKFIAVVVTWFHLSSVTMGNLLINFKYENLLTSVKFHVVGLVYLFSPGMALLNEIWLQMTQNKMKICTSRHVLPVSQNIFKIFKKCLLSGRTFIIFLKKMYFICNA